jgi:alpha-mannosidase
VLPFAALAFGAFASAAPAFSPALVAQEPRDLPITHWAVLGAFPADTAAAALDSAQVPGEARLAPGATPVRGVAWRAARADTAGRVDLLALLGRRALDRQVAYAVAWLTAPAERTVDLAVESDDDIAVWLNGVAIHRHVVTRAVWMEADTVTVRLAPGTNRLVYKVANRDGGFGFGGRILAASPGGLAGLAVADAPLKVAATSGRTGAAVTVGPVHLPERAVLGGGELLVPLSARVTRWGDSAAAAALSIGSVRVSVPARTMGEAAATTIAVPWVELAGLARGGGFALSVGIGEGGARAVRTVAQPSDPLLDELSRPIALRDWQIDSGRTALRASFQVPAALAGLPLVLEAAEFSRGAAITIDGRPARADSAGLVPLCDRCPSGSTHQIVIDAHGITWWDPPALRVAMPGWREIREGARWGARFAPKLAPSPPSASTADSLLAAAADPSKVAYQAIIRRWLARLDPAAAAIRRDTIDVVGNSHLDVVWLWELVDGIEVLRNTWRTATKLLAKYPRMHFAASSAYYYALLEREDPALLARIRSLVQDGRWDLVGGWWIEPDANMPSGESLVRQGLYGQRTLRRLFGRTVHVGWTPDTFGYPWTLPQILLGSGLDGFVTQKLRWNDRNPWPPGLDAFWWEGPDGSRVLTYVPYGYDHDLDPDRLAAELDSTITGGRMRRMLVLYGVGDHGGGPTIEMLERGRDLRRVPTFPPLRDTSPDSALARMRRDLPAGPTLRDELYLEYHRGAFTTNGAMKWWNRRMEGLLGAAEAAASVSPLPYPRAQLTRAWEMTLINQMHDILPGTSIRAVHRQAEADYAAADSLAGRMLDRSVRALVANTDTRAPRKGWRPYAVFNPSGHARGGVVRIPLPPGSPTGVRAHDGSGRELSSAVVRDTLRAAVPDVPALSAVIIFVGTGTGTGAGPASGSGRAPVPAGRGSRILENAALRVEIDSATGRIARMFDKTQGREVLRPGGNALTMLEDRPGSWDAWNINHLNGRRTPIDQQVSVGRAEGSAERSLTVRRRRGDVVVEQRYVLPMAGARLDIETTIAWHTEHQLLKASFVLPFRADSVTSEIAYGAIARPTRPRTSRDSARFEVPMHRWLDASAGGYGVAIVNDSKYGFDALGDTIRLSLLRAPTIPDAISDQRTHHFTYSIVPHAGDWRAPEVTAAADELNDPLRAVDVEEHGGGAPPAPPVVLEGSGVRLGAIKRAEDGDALVLRLVETDGKASSAMLRFAAPAMIREANLLEDPLGAASAPVSQLGIRLRPWEIRTLLVRTSR